VSPSKTVESLLEAVHSFIQLSQIMDGYILTGIVFQRALVEVLQNSGITGTFIDRLEPRPNIVAITAETPCLLELGCSTAEVATVIERRAQQIADNVWGQPNYEQFFLGKWVTLFCSE
jgi:hypothetical protein